ncbi:MAG: glycosyltransferase [Deltaproteobacteria bacterium]|nr:glycosyltransferase [Deltaproteobacteria bacterium]
MKLGIITSQLSHYGGSEVYLLECLRRWQDVLDITLYTPLFRRALLSEFGVGSRVKVVRLPGGRTGPDAFFYNTVVLPRLWEQIIGPHDLYFMYLFPTHFIQRRPAVWFAAEPLRILYDLRRENDGGVEVSIHLYPKMQYDRVSVSELDVLLHLVETIDSSAGIDRLATNSRTTGKYLRTIYGRDPDRVVYPGVNLPAKVSPPSVAEPLLFIGNLWQHKRVDLVIKALAQLQDVRLRIVGEGPEKQNLRRLARSLGLDGRVLFSGRVDQDALSDVYARSSVCVYTPQREPFGMVPLEAAAAARPVIATEGGGYSEVLNDTCARFVPAHPDKIAESIATVLGDRGLARRMGEAGREIAANHSWERTAGELLDLFRETVSRGAARPRRPPLGAHYYPWYHAGDQPQHWNENREFAAVTDPPLGGNYSSADPGLIHRHLQMAADAQLDFLVVNWQVTFQGLNPTELEATRMLFAAAEKAPRPLTLAILLAINTDDARVVEGAVNTLRTEFMRSPVYQRVRGRPLLWYYLSGPFLGFFFYQRDLLTQLTRGFYAIATGQIIFNQFVPRPLREFFSGWCVYSPLQVGRRTVREAIWTSSYRSFAENGGAVRVFTVCPGYDDTRLASPQRSQSRYRFTPRRGTRTYEHMQQVALNLEPSPDLVVVTSFNEFHENTHIEPSLAFGDTFLRSTQSFKEALRRRRARP